MDDFELYEGTKLQDTMHNVQGFLGDVKNSVKEMDLLGWLGLTEEDLAMSRGSADAPSRQGGVLDLLRQLFGPSPEAQQQPQMEAVIGEAKFKPRTEAVIGEAELRPPQERGETPRPPQERGPR